MINAFTLRKHWLPSSSFHQAHVKGATVLGRPQHVRHISHSQAQPLGFIRMAKNRWRRIAEGFAGRSTADCMECWESPQSFADNDFQQW
jgi:hypothetical protein